RDQHEHIRSLAHAGKQALEAGQSAAAAGRYREAGELAARIRAGAVVRAEIAYGLGQALLRSGDLPGAVSALEQATELAPTEADFEFLLGYVLFAQDQPESDQAARVALTRSLALGLSGDDSARAHRLLGAIAGHGGSSSRSLTLELRAG